MNDDQRYRESLVMRVADRLSMTRERIADVLSRSERLQQMCEEYEACCVARERWRAIEATGHRRNGEFETLSDEIEGEIVRWFADHLDDSSGSTSR